MTGLHTIERALPLAVGQACYDVTFPSGQRLWPKRFRRVRDYGLLHANAKDLRLHGLRDASQGSDGMHAGLRFETAFERSRSEAGWHFYNEDKTCSRLLHLDVRHQWEIPQAHYKVKWQLDRSPFPLSR